MMAVVHSAILKLCYIFWVLSPPVGSFTDSFLAHYSVHIRFHWVLKPHWKEILLPLLFFSSIELHSTTTESVPFFRVAHESQVYRVSGQRLLQGKSSHYTETLLYPRATSLRFWTDYAHRFYFTENEFLSRRLLSSSNK